MFARKACDEAKGESGVMWRRHEGEGGEEVQCFGVCVGG